MKKGIIIFSIVLISIHVKSQDLSFDWAKQMGGNLGASSYSLKLDESGNIYSTGEFFGNGDFDPGNEIYTLNSFGGTDIFVSKLDSLGEFLWAKKFGGPSHDRCQSIAVDNLSNVFTTGIFEGTVDFDPGTSIYNLTAVGNLNCFISKLDANGNFVWAKQFESTSWSGGMAITVDKLGNVYSTGMFRDTTDFNPGNNCFNLISTGYDDIFISKLDSSGNFVWAKQFEGLDPGNGNGIAVDEEGNIIIMGNFYGSTDFDPGISSFVLTSKGESDIFISKLDSAGNFIWANQLGGSSYDICNSISVDELGNVYTTGRFSGTSDFNPGVEVFNLTSTGEKDIYISKIKSNGDFIWAKRMGGNITSVGNSISVDCSGNVYTTGSFFGTVDFDPGIDIYNLTFAGNYDVFISKLDLYGNFKWAKQLGGPSIDEGNSVVVDAKGNVYTSGTFHETVDFNPCGGSFNLTSVGGNNIFIQKMRQQNVGINKLISNAEVKAYPNPLKNQMIIELGSTYPDLMVVVRNYSGQVISSEAHNFTDKVFLEINGDIGIYLVEIKSANRQVAQIKVIKD